MKLIHKLLCRLGIHVEYIQTRTIQPREITQHRIVCFFCGRAEPWHE